jgi:hypothetical protein
MEKFAFLTRHAPTAGQIAIAERAGIILEPIGDRDAFSVTVADIDAAGAFDGVVVVHPAAALRLASAFVIGVFENANRAHEGEKPSFEAVSLHLYDLVD